MRLTDLSRELIKTDLAAERRRADTAVPGTNYREERDGVLLLEDLRITTPEAAAAIGKPEGTYLTAAFPPLFKVGPHRNVCVQTLTRLLASLLPLKNPRPLLVIGLGNGDLTPDSVGPRAAGAVLATAHLQENGICVLCPGVMGQSGLEAARLVRAAAKEIDAGAVIAIDALCARSPARLVSTIQLCDTGITPGSGIRESRHAIDAATVGVPVIAVGIPTLVSSAALVFEALEKAGADEIPPAFREMMYEKDYYVCPKNIDEGIVRGTSLVADSINCLPNGACAL